MPLTNKPTWQDMLDFGPVSYWRSQRGSDGAWVVGVAIDPTTTLAVVCSNPDIAPTWAKVVCRCDDLPVAQAIAAWCQQQQAGAA